MFRHSVTTEYLRRGALTKHQGDQFFGSPRGNTAVHYQNYFGDEAADSLGVYFGVTQKQPPKVPKERQCPNINCQELNTPEAPFCVKCRIPLSVAGHLEREEEIIELKDQMSQMMQTFESYHGLAKKRMNQMDNSIKFLTEEITKYRGQFGPRPLTEKERNKIEESLEEIRALPPESEYIPDDDF